MSRSLPASKGAIRGPMVNAMIGNRLNGKVAVNEPIRKTGRHADKGIDFNHNGSLKRKLSALSARTQH